MYNPTIGQSNSDDIMGCRSCQTAQVFKQKLGRCRQCMIQLSLLNVICWGAWYYFYLPTPTVVESITLLFAATAFSLLLLAHWVVALMLWLKNTNKSAHQQQSP
ncbi:DUF3624 domain-containing protein [Photobacterium sp. OFAV2-7]|uniref:DUF3624 domain-containing protein n=1 Tax=Photobacterium sp. OFAV2-7 TaxID=2917748 RepID=UPI001EF5DFA3|nr:DUF3624 domain-containing protein [Photobacterium sp. OFAV2-7]MCG7584632.1 DUF3624 domain-containing protein [Photobacterium sp. OFAV2-7]